MADKKEEVKIVLEREYNVPLRREFIKTANWKKTKKASKALKEFLAKHMKTEKRDIRLVKIGKDLNEFVWKHGIKNPPHHVKVLAKKDDKGIVTADLIAEKRKGLEKKAEKEDKKTEEKKVEKKTETPAASEKKEEVAGKEKTEEKTSKEKK